MSSNRKQHFTFSVAVVLLFFQSAIAQQQTASQLRDSAYAKVRIKDESRFYINIHGGYALGLGSTFKFYPDDVKSISVMQVGNNAPSKETIYQAPTKGLGQGLRVGVGFSYIVNDFLNIGMDIDYFQSTISKSRDSSFFSTQLGTPAIDSIYTEKYTISYETKLLTFTPHVIFKAISRPNWFVYNKVGLVATFRPNSLQREFTSGNFKTGTAGAYKDSAVSVGRVYDWGIRNPSIGFMGGIGSQFKLVGNIRAFAEVQFSHLVFVVRDRTVSSYKVNNQELVGSLPVSERELRFERNLSSTDLTTGPDQPTRTIIQRIPITYVGVQAGLAYKL